MDNNEKRNTRSYKNKKEYEQIQKRKKERKKTLIKLYILITVVMALLVFLLVTMFSSSKEKLREKGINSYNSGNYNEAVDYFNEALNEKQLGSSKIDKDIKLYLADSYIKLECFDEAKAIYKNLLAKSKNNKEFDYITLQIHLTDALSALKKDDYQTALPYLLEAVETGNNSMYLYLGACYQKTGDYSNMIKAYNSYLASFPINTYIAYQMSSYYLEVGDLDNAYNYIEQGLNTSDTEYLNKVLYNEIVYYEKNFDYTKALEKAISYINAYPDDEQGKKEYTILDSRINMNEEPVHKKPEAETTNN